MLKKITATLFALVIVLSLCACGAKSTTLEQFNIIVGDRALTALEAGESYRCVDGEITRTYNEKETTKPGEISVCGLSVGSTLEDVLEVLEVKAGYAAFEYEYDPYGDGCTEMGTIAYDGTMPSIEEIKPLDLCLRLLYIFENGKWVPVEISEVEDCSGVLALYFDAEGTHDMYGQEVGHIFSIECKLLSE